METTILKRAFLIAAAMAFAVTASTFAFGAEATIGEYSGGGGQDDIGMVLATMNTTLIYRGGESFTARLGDYIRVNDAFETAEFSKAKIILTDGGTITLDQVSKMSVEGLGSGDGTVQSGEPGGQSEYKLFGGFMRLVSGSSAFEIRTDEAVISGNDSVVEIVAGSEDGRLFTAVACLDGTVRVESVGLGEAISLVKNQIVTLTEGETMKKPLTLPSTGIKAMSNTDIARFAVRATIEGIQKELGSATGLDEGLPVSQQPVATTPVTIRIEFP